MGWVFNATPRPLYPQERPGAHYIGGWVGPRDGLQWRTEGGLGCSTPPPEIPKALENRAKLNPIVKTVKNC